MKILAAIVLALALTVTAGPAFAHGTTTAWYGGQIIEVTEGWRIEFAVRDGAIRAWVRDHDDKAVAATGKATLLVNGKKVTATFKNDGDSLLAEAPIKAADKVAAILSLTVNGKPVSARFGQEAVVIAELKGPAQAGKKAFEEVCAACHGVALRGSDTAPPLLHAFYAPGSGHGDDVMLAAIKNGAKSHMWKFGDMPKPEDVPSGQETNIIAYIRAMQAANGLGGSAATPIDHSGHASH